MKANSSFKLAALACVLGMPGLAAANADVEKLTANPANWAMQAGDMYNQRYSKLNHINATNVGRLQVAWTFSTGVLRGHEGSPLAIGNMMYIHSPFPNKVFAVNLDSQKIAWKYEPKQDPAVIPQMCCDTVTAVWPTPKARCFCSRPTAISWRSTPGAARSSGRCRTAIPRSVR